MSDFSWRTMVLILMWIAMIVAGVCLVLTVLDVWREWHPVAVWATLVFCVGFVVTARITWVVTAFYLEERRARK